MAVGVSLLVLGSCLLVGLRLGLLTRWPMLREMGRDRRGFVTMHAAHRAWLRNLRLTEPEHFLGLEALIVSGHPGRQVGRLVLGETPHQRTLYLKREQGVRWTTRLLNFLSGFGWVSRSVREAQLLDALERDDLPGPRWLATGEDSIGRAFLLVEEVHASSSLTAALQAQAGPRERRALAIHLGATLARLHAAGFFHRDLYAKHVLVGDTTSDLCLLDWQRAWRGAWIPRSSRIRDLACLHVTLPEGLAGRGERLACLRAYLGKECRRPIVRRLLAEVETLAKRLRQRRHIREKRQPPTEEQQAWICLDGQALCITPALAEMTTGESLDWLGLDRQPLPAGETMTQRWLTFPGGRRVLLVRQQRWISRWRLLRNWLLRKPIVSPQQRQATLLWRLERHGVPAPRVLAVGHRRQGRQVDSFLLSEPLDPVLRLEGWLQSDCPRPQEAEMFFQAGVLLARMHDACCYLEQPLQSLAVRFGRFPERGEPLRERREREVVLEDAAHVASRRRPCPALARRDLAAFRTCFATWTGNPANGWSQVEQGYASVVGPSPPNPLWRYRTPGSYTSDSNPPMGKGEAGHGQEPDPGRRAEVKPATLWQRLARGGQRIHARPDWESYAGPDWPERIMHIEVADDFHAKQGRSTCRWVLTRADGGRLTVYLKRHYRLPFWHGWAATLWCGGDWSPAMQEYRHLEWARQQGVPVPATVAAGEFIGPWGMLCSFLAVEELTDMLPLHQAIPLAASRLPAPVFRKWKFGLTAEMARLARLLHDRRHFHKDLYLCHFFIHRDDTGRIPSSALSAWRGKVVLIDLHRLTHHPWTWWLWLLKDLAQLLYSSEVPGVDVRDQLAFWKHYRGPAARGIASRWLRRLVLMKWRRYRSHNLRKKQRMAAQTLKG